MAKKSKNNKSEIQVEAVSESFQPDNTSLDTASDEFNKYEELVIAAKNLVKLYEASHTINSIEDYKYPGLKNLVVALQKL